MLGVSHDTTGAADVAPECSWRTVHATQHEVFPYSAWEWFPLPPEGTKLVLYNAQSAVADVSVILPITDKVRLLFQMTRVRLTARVGSNVQGVILQGVICTSLVVRYTHRLQARSRPWNQRALSSFGCTVMLWRRRSSLRCCARTYSRSRACNITTSLLLVSQ